MRASVLPPIIPFHAAVQAALTSVVFVLAVWTPAHAQAGGLPGAAFHVERIDVRHGFPQKRVFALAQDPAGFVWFGTGISLQRFDGHDLVVYQHTADSTSLSANWVKSICPDPDGSLWVGTLSGLNLFDPRSGTFKRFLHDPNNPGSLSSNEITSLLIDRSGVLWVGTISGLNRLDRGVGTWRRFLPDAGDRPRAGDNAVNAIIEGEDGRLWVGTGWWGAAGGGLLSLDPTSGRFTRHPGHSPVPNDRVATLSMDAAGVLWLGTDAAGVKIFHQSTETFEHVPLPGDRSTPGRTAPSPPPVTSIVHDEAGGVWIATYGSGLYRLDRARNGFDRFEPDPSDSRSISSLDLNRLFIDRAGLLWVGTDGGGVNTIARKPFVRGRRLGAFLSESRNVISILAEPAGTLLLAVRGEGLWRYEPSTRRAIQLVKDAPITTMSRDRTGGILLTYPDAVKRYDPRTNTVRHLWRIPENAVGPWGPGSVLDATDGWLWVAGGGVLRINQETGRVQRFIPGDSTAGGLPPGEWSHLAEDSAGAVWVGGTLGVAEYDLKTGAFTPHARDPDDSTSLTDDYITGLYVDVSGTLWVSTRNGLNRFDRATRRFQRFYPPLHPGDAVSPGRTTGAMALGTILEDGSGRLWISSIKEVYRFDPRTGAFVSFDESDGLGDLSPGFGTAARIPGGEIIYATPGGVLLVHPDSARVSSIPPPVAITRLQKLDSTVTPVPGPDGTLQIELAPGENVLSIEFVALSYDMMEFNTYSYRLEGFAENWTHPSNRRTATYTNLDPGSYLFRVRGSNHDGIWNESGASLRVVVHPPWWRTFWAYGLYVLLLAGVVLLVHRYQSERIRLRERASLKDLEARKLREVEQLKSRFFANISHEFRTPLTLILSPVERWQQRATEESLQRDMTVVERNARRLLRLVNQLLDLSKLEAGAVKLRVSTGDIGALLRGIAWSFQSSAETRAVTLTVTVPDEATDAVFDRERVEHIVTNLLSNAFKFTPPGGTVKVEGAVVRPADGAVQDGRWFELTVADSGIGIPESALAHIFDRFYQVDASSVREAGGTGIGLALTKELVDLHRGSISVRSVPGEGTAFVVRLPIGMEAYRPDEILESPATASEPLALPSEAGLSPAGMGASEGTGSIDLPLVLVIEDNPDLRAYIRETLSSAFRTAEAIDGEDGVAKALELVPDLIISDVMMPKMDGYDVCRAVKSDQRTSHVPVILLTAKAGRESRIEGLETGADDYLTKPFVARELLVRIRNLIDLRRRLRERFSTSQPLKPGEIAVTSMDDAFLRKVMAVVEERLASEDFTVEELAAGVAMSRSQLHRKLTALTGQAPFEFIRYMRLHRAKALLEGQAGNVSDIAFASGFSSVSYFSKCFKDQFGITPSEVRRA